MSSARRFVLQDMKFARLTVVAPAPNGRWKCKCDCGNERIVVAFDLVNEKTKSCGCLKGDVGAARTRTHGRTRSVEYRAWRLLRGRCENINNPQFADYGGRGIRVCERWSSFALFLADVGCRPSSAYSIDRIDVNGNYEPGNVRWATRDQQAQNTRRNAFTEATANEALGRMEHGESWQSVCARMRIGKSALMHVRYGRSWKQIGRYAA